MHDDNRKKPSQYIFIVIYLDWCFVDGSKGDKD